MSTAVIATYYVLAREPRRLSLRPRVPAGHGYPLLSVIARPWYAWIAQQDLPHVDRRTMFLTLAFAVLLTGVMLAGS